MELAKSGTTKIYRVKQLIRLLSISKSTIYGWIKDDKFPKGTKINGITVWKSETIDEWLEEQTKENEDEVSAISN
jgi:prophage regulatory protein